MESLERSTCIIIHGPAVRLAGVSAAGRGFGSVPARMDLVLRAERPVVGAAGLLWAGTAVCGLGPLWRMRSQHQEALEGGGTIAERTQPGARRLPLGNRTSRKEEGARATVR